MVKQNSRCLKTRPVQGSVFQKYLLSETQRDSSIKIKVGSLGRSPFSQLCMYNKHLKSERSDFGAF